MVLYRRNRVPGGTYFFTVTLRDRSSGLLVQYIDHLRHVFRTTHRERPFRLEAIVILPDHLYTLWTLLSGDADYAGRWRALKSRFTQALRPQGVPLHADARGEYRLWQRRYWEHTICRRRFPMELAVGGSLVLTPTVIALSLDTPMDKSPVLLRQPTWT